MTVMHEVLKELGAAARRYVRSAIGDMDADDVAQEAALRSLRAGSGVLFCERSDVGRFASVAVRSAARDAARKARRRQEVPGVDDLVTVSPMPDPEAMLLGRERARYRVTPRRSVLLMRLSSGESMTSIAREEGVPTSTISRRAKREMRLAAYEADQLVLFADHATITLR